MSTTTPTTAASASISPPPTTPTSRATPIAMAWTGPSRRVSSLPKTATTVTPGPSTSRCFRSSRALTRPGLRQCPTSTSPPGCTRSPSPWSRVFTSMAVTVRTSRSGILPSTRRLSWGCPTPPRSRGPSTAWTSSTSRLPCRASISSAVMPWNPGGRATHCTSRTLTAQPDSSATGSSPATAATEPTAQTAQTAATELTANPGRGPTTS